MSRCHLVMHGAIRSRPDPDVLLYYGKAVGGLRTALECEVVDDAAPAAIMALMSIDLMSANTRAFQQHLYGLRSIVAKKGGAEKLAHSSIQGSLFRTFNSFWSYVTRTLDASSSPSPHCIEVQASCEESPSAVLLDLPPGVRELALMGHIRQPVIEIDRRLFFRHAVQMKDGPSFEKTTCASAAAFHRDLEEVAILLTDDSLLTAERFLCIAMFFRALHATAVGSATSIYVRLAQTHCLELLEVDEHALDQAQRSCFVYVLLVLLRTVLAVLSDSNDLTSLLLKMMKKDPMLQDWLSVRTVLEQFVNNAGCITRYHDVWQECRRYAEEATAGELAVNDG